jgi:hypothetical protein
MIIHEARRPHDTGASSRLAPGPEAAPLFLRDGVPIAGRKVGTLLIQRLMRNHRAGRHPVIGPRPHPSVFPTQNRGTSTYERKGAFTTLLRGNGGRDADASSLATKGGRGPRVSGTKGISPFFFCLEARHRPAGRESSSAPGQKWDNRKEDDQCLA